MTPKGDVGSMKTLEVENMILKITLAIERQILYNLDIKKADQKNCLNYFKM